jgi:hypothetical protein
MSSRVSWGHGEEHYRRGDPFTPGGMFRGRAGVVVEVAPNQFMSWKMRGTYGSVDVEQELDEIHTWESVMLLHVPTFSVVTFELSGYLDAREDQAPRPDWATEPAGELEARRALEGR